MTTRGFWMILILPTCVAMNGLVGQNAQGLCLSWCSISWLMLAGLAKWSTFTGMTMNHSHGCYYGYVPVSTMARKSTHSRWKLGYQLTMAHVSKRSYLSFPYSSNEVSSLLHHINNTGQQPHPLSVKQFWGRFTVILHLSLTMHLTPPALLILTPLPNFCSKSFLPTFSNLKVMSILFHTVRCIFPVRYRELFWNYQYHFHLQLWLNLLIMRVHLSPRVSTNKSTEQRYWWLVYN